MRLVPSATYRQRGDTIIELLLAFAIFSLAAVTTLAILNQGVAMSQRSLEKSLARQQVDSQAEMIRYLQSTHDPAWKTLTGKITATPLPLTSSGGCPAIDTSTKSFFVTAAPSQADPTKSIFNVISIDSTNFQSAQTYAQVSYDTAKSYGLWVQVAQAENNTKGVVPDAYDFYIHGCWDSVGQTIPMSVGTIVRIYDK